MKIAKQFPQFKKERVLIMLTGTQEAEFYLAGDGYIEKIESFRIPRIRYSDKEGLAMRTGKTGVSGGSLRSVKEQYRQAFAAKYKAVIKDALTRIAPTQLIIVSPIIPEIEQLLPATAKKLIRIRLKKNLCEQHEEELLTHINKELNK